MNKNTNRGNALTKKSGTAENPNIIEKTCNLLQYTTKAGRLDEYDIKKIYEKRKERWKV